MIHSGINRIIPKQVIKTYATSPYAVGSKGWSTQVNRVYFRTQSIMIRCEKYVMMGIMSYHEAIREVEQELLISIIGLMGNNLQATSRFLNLSRTGICTKLNRWDVQRTYSDDMTTFIYWSYVPCLGATGR